MSSSDIWGNDTLADSECRGSAGNTYHPVALEVLFVTLIASVTSAGNLLTLLVFIGSRYLRNAHGLIIISLAISDLGVGIAALWSIYPTAAQVWPHRPAFCAIQGFVFEVCHANSYFVTIYLSVERYMAVIHPVKYAKHVTYRNVIIILVVTWAAPLVGFGVPSLTGGFEYTFNNPVRTCLVGWRQLNNLPVGAVFIWALCSIMTFGLVTYTGTRVSMTMKELAIKRQGTYKKTEAKSGLPSRGVRQAVITFKISVVILVAFYLLRAPYLITVLVTGIALDKCAIPEMLLFSTYWLFMADACFNFFVYVVMNKNFRREFRRIVLRQECRPPKDTKTPSSNERSESRFKPGISTIPVEASNTSSRMSADNAI